MWRVKVSWIVILSQSQFFEQAIPYRRVHSSVSVGRAFIEPRFLFDLPALNHGNFFLTLSLPFLVIAHDCVKSNPNGLENRLIWMRYGGLDAVAWPGDAGSRKRSGKWRSSRRRLREKGCRLTRIRGRRCGSKYASLDSDAISRELHTKVNHVRTGKLSLFLSLSF